MGLLKDSIHPFRLVGDAIESVGLWIKNGVKDGIDATGKLMMAAGSITGLPAFAGLCSALAFGVGNGLTAFLATATSYASLGGLGALIGNVGAAGVLGSGAVLGALVFVAGYLLADKEKNRKKTKSGAPMLAIA